MPITGTVSDDMFLGDEKMILPKFELFDMAGFLTSVGYLKSEKVHTSSSHFDNGVRNKIVSISKWGLKMPQTMYHVRKACAILPFR